MRSSGRRGAACLLRRRLRSGNLFCHRVRPAGRFDPLGIGWAASWVAGVWDATFLDAPRLRRRARLETTSPKGRQGYHTIWLIKNISNRRKDYLPVGQRMPGTRFIAFQVPLQKSFEEKLAPEERFSPLNRFNKTREQNEELGLIIDLTYTQRYYKPEPSKATAILEHTKGSTPKHAAKRPVPEPEDIRLCCTGSKKKKKSGKRADRDMDIWKTSHHVGSQEQGS